MNDTSPETHLDIFLRATRIVALRMAQAFADADAVRTPDASVLVTLDRAPDRRMRMDELRQELLMEKSSVSRAVDRLERAGYVQRLASKQDRRAVYAAMTSEGRNALRHATRVFRATFDEVFLAGLTPAELEQMTELLRRLYLANLPARQAETPSGPEAVSAV